MIGTDAVADLIPESLVNEWESESVEVERIRNEIGRLWSEWDRAYEESLVSSPNGVGEQVYMRPATVNLIAIAGSADDARQIESTVGAIPNYTPSRTIILARQGRGPDVQGFRIRVEISEAMPERRSAPIRTELVTISAPVGNDEVLASVSTALLMPDLPDVLFVPRQPTEGNPLVEMLIDRVDHVLVDSASADDPGSSLKFLCDLRRGIGKPPCGDLTWSRIQNWRQLIAQFFDPPAARTCLDTINSVDIVVAARNEGSRSGLTAGLLMAGWLSSRLDWRVPGELVEIESGWKLTLRSGSRRKSREIPLMIGEGSAPTSCSSLVRVRIESGRDHTGVFTVTRSHAEAISTVSEIENAMEVDRMVHSPCPDESTLLGQELRLLREDRAYGDALAIAADLWPAEIGREGSE